MLKHLCVGVAGVLTGAALLSGSQMAQAQLRDISGDRPSGGEIAAVGAGSGASAASSEKILGVFDTMEEFEAAAKAGPGKHVPVVKDIGRMKGHGHTKGDGPEPLTELQAENHHERVHAGGKPQSFHDELHAKARETAAQNMEKHGEAHLDEGHAPLPPGKVDTEEMYVHPKTRIGREGPTRLGPINHTGFGHVHVDPPLHIDPDWEMHDGVFDHPGVKFDERDERQDPTHADHEEHQKEERERAYQHRKKLREHKEKHGIKSIHPRRNKPKHHREEELGYWGAQREKDGVPHPSEAYDYLHWEIEELREEHQDAIHLYGEHSQEEREIKLLLHQLTSVNRLVDYLDWGMPQEEFDQVVEWINEAHEVRWKHQILSIDFDEASHIDRHAEPERFAEAMHLHSEELHRLEDRETELKEKIKAAKEHHHMLYKPIENEGTITERVKLRELYEKVHHTHNRTERAILRHEYNERMETLEHRRRLHGMPEDEKALIQEIREKIHVTTDEDELSQLRHEVEEIYEKHRDRAREAGHFDDVHRPDLGHHRLEYNDMLHESDPELLSYHDALRRTKTADERRILKIKIRDREYELHHNGKKHPRHGVHA